MALLFLGLIGEGNLPETVDGAANEILHYLPMLLVPAGVGMLHLSGLVDGEWPGRAAAIVGSSTLAIAITGLVMIWLDRCPQLSPETQENLEFHQSTAGRR